MRSTAVALVVVSILAICLPSTLADTQVYGGGSTALKSFISSVLSNASQDIDIKGYDFPYNAVGVSQGITGFLNGTFDYGIGDEGIQPKSSNGLPFLTIPICLSSVSFFYNIPGLPSNQTLQLGPDAISGIYTGEITTWDDPLIVSYNSGKSGTVNITSLVKKNQAIYPVARKDLSGSTYLVSKWLTNTVGEAALNTTSDMYYWHYPVADTITWTSGINTVSGSGAMVTAVQTTPYALGYVDSSSGLQASPKLPEAALLNRNGNFLTSAKASYSFNQTASNGVNTSLITGVPAANDTNGWSSYTLAYLPGSKTYPLTSIGYLYTQQDLRYKASTGAAQKQLFAYIIGPYSQPGIAAFGQYPLPNVLIKNALAGIESILAQSTELFNPVTLVPGFVY